MTDWTETANDLWSARNDLKRIQRTLPDNEEGRYIRYALAEAIGYVQVALEHTSDVESREAGA